jgi:hypothetical protein
VPYALVVTVSLEGAQDGEEMLRQQVIPAVKQQAGFLSGTWSRSEDGNNGMGIVLFDTKDNAKAAEQGTPRVRPEGAPAITGSSVHEVVGQA